MTERQGVITFGGAPLTLLGNEIKAGDKAPDFTLTDNDLAPKTLADYKRQSSHHIRCPFAGHFGL